MSTFTYSNHGFLPERLKKLRGWEEIPRVPDRMNDIANWRMKDCNMSCGLSFSQIEQWKRWETLSHRSTESEVFSMHTGCGWFTRSRSLGFGY